MGFKTFMILLEKLFLLREVSLFKEVSDELLAEIASYAEEEKVLGGQTIITKGEIGDIMYIIVAGKVVVKDEGKILAEFGEKQIFGELAVLSPEPRSATVEALEETLLLKLRRQDFIDFLSVEPKLAMGIIIELCARIRAANVLLQQTKGLS
jgi:CRP/FNR family transcriptional regulator, cyclic AMP receptor protein